MKKQMFFGEVLEAADKLSLEEQEAIVNILHKRMIEYRRSELAKEIHEAQQEYQSGRCQPSTPDKIIKEIIS